MRQHAIASRMKKGSREHVARRAPALRAPKPRRTGLIVTVVMTGLMLTGEPSFARTELQQTQAEGGLVSWRNVGAAGREAGGLENLPAPTQDLFTRLDELLATDGGPNRFGQGLDLSPSALDAAYQQTASEETTTFRSALTESSYARVNNVLSRLAGLRAGATGLSVAGLSINPNVPGVAPLASAEVLGSAHGGGASADHTLINGKLGIFVNGAFGTGDLDATEREDGYDYDTYGITAGVDYRLTQNFVFGGAFGYSWLDSQYKPSAAVAGGSVDASGYSVAAYGTYYTERLYLDGIASFGRNDYDLARRVLVPLGSASTVSQAEWDRTAKAETTSDQYLLGLGAGYDIPWGATTITPYLRANYLKAEIDGYTETGALGLEFVTSDYDTDSMVTVLGVSGMHALSQTLGVIVPQGRFAWVHEFLNDPQTINYRYVWEAVPTGGSPWVFPVQTEEPDRDYFVLGFGLSSVFRNSIQAFLDYQTILGHYRMTEHLFTAGLRSDF